MYNSGLTTNAAYPYTNGASAQSSACSQSGGGYYFNYYKYDVIVCGSDRCPSIDPNLPTCTYPNEVAGMIYQLGVGAAYISISSNAFMFYKSGILTSSSGCTGTPNFWVALVGYFTSTLSTSYWTIQNSWGTGWGQAGYAQIAITPSSKGNIAGVCGV